jgi:hypothetical protein
MSQVMLKASKIIAAQAPRDQLLRLFSDRQWRLIIFHDNPTKK